jgi:hypothetical protein
MIACPEKTVPGRFNLKAPTFGETCSQCGGDVRIIASIEDPEMIRKILAHLDEKVTPTATGLLQESRAPPATGLFA